MSALPSPTVHLVSDHFDGRIFFNPGGRVDRSFLHALGWKLTSRRDPWPAWLDLPVATPPPRPATGVAATWINHSTFLLQTPDCTLVTDPQWSDRASPVGWLGPRRVHPPGIAFDRLPPLDAILLSHDHYDHCDLPTLRRLGLRHPQARLLAPAGFGPLARRAGFSTKRTTLLDWWETADLPGGHEVTATPARHWGNRLTGPRNSRLWCGYSVGTGRSRVHFCGDTSYDASLFKDIRARLGPVDLGLIPIGGYEPRWFMKEMHCDPAEAVRIHQDLGATRSIGMHWGTFRLTDEAREQPVRTLAEAARSAGLPAEAFVALQPGESLVV